MRGVARGVDGFLPDLATKRDFGDEARLAGLWFLRDVTDRIEGGLMSWKNWFQALLLRVADKCKNTRWN